MRRAFTASILVLAGFAACDDYGESSSPKPPAETRDAEASDAAGDVVGPADAGAEAATSSLCESAGAKFCADFDGVDKVEEGFTSVDTRNGATITLDTVRTLSAPHSALFTVPPDAGACTFGQLVRDLPGTFGTAELSFAAFIDVDPALTPSSLAALEINQQCSIIVAPFGDDPRARVQYESTGASGQPVALARSLARAKWERITLELRVNGTAPAVRIRLGSDVVAELATLPSPCTTSGAVRVQLGPHCVDTLAQPLALRIDDVLVNAN